MRLFNADTDTDDVFSVFFYKFYRYSDEKILTDKKRPQIVGLRRNATSSKREMFTNRKPTLDFVLTLSTKFCSVCHRFTYI